MYQKVYFLERLAVFYTNRCRIPIEVFKEYYQKYLSREMKAMDIQKALSISKQSYYNYARQINGV